MDKRRAIILFVRNERHEAALKPLPAPLRVQGYGAINQRTIARMQPALRSGIDLVVVSESRMETPSRVPHLLQRGTTFGERITNAITDTLACGYDEVVAVGNDCPTMTSSDLLAAFGQLTGGASVVAAPARDGGVFLVGAQLGFDIAVFTALPWQTSQLFAAICQLNGAATLPIVRDDFDSWNSGRAQQALAQLLGLYCTIAPPPLPFYPLLSRATVKARTRIYLTAPPVV